jgi:hypothetical protein
MKYSNLLIRTAGVAALLVATAAPAYAQSSTDRARMAQSEASAKIDAAVKIGGAGEAPRLLAEAQAALRSSKEQLARSHERDAIDEANRASMLADQALGVADRAKNDAAVEQANRASDAEATAAAAQQQAASQAEQRAAAESSAASAQAEAAAANDRAAVAQQAASNAAADAAAVRAAAATPTTTVTVQRETTPAYSVKKTTTKKPVRKVRKATSTTTVVRPATSTTTTTVKTEPAPQ